MNSDTDAASLRAIHARMKNVVRGIRLPFRRHNWRGLAGNWLGVGIGSSIDFQDHRPYLPGDDPRYIDWQAYARTGAYTMKLYREEVSPRVDLVLDNSLSMDITEAKRSRFRELVYFAMESALQTGAGVRVFAVGEGGWKPIPLPALAGYQWPRPEGADGFPGLGALPFRHGSMRVWITDLLFSGSPESGLRALLAGRGRAVILAPFATEETAPTWSGNVELRDCETGFRRRQRVGDPERKAYREAYHRHFELWTDQCRRRSIPLARIPAEGDVVDALLQGAVREGAVEVLT